MPRNGSPGRGRARAPREGHDAEGDIQARAPNQAANPDLGEPLTPQALLADWVSDIRPARPRVARLMA